MRYMLLKINVKFFLELALVAIPVLFLSGCRLPGKQGPVPQSLSDCRRLSQRGAAALERGELDKAEKLLLQAVSTCPVDAEARRRYAEALWRRGAAQDAIYQMEEATKLLPDDAVLWARLAEMRLAAGQIDFARRDAEFALNLEPKLASAWMVCGGVARISGKMDEALSYYLRALQYSPKDRNILYQVAEIHRAMNQPEKALLALQTLADSYSPGNEPGEVFYLMGMAYAAMQRYDDAVDSFTVAVTRPNATADMYYRLAESQLMLGRIKEASAAACQALAMQPQHPASKELIQQIEIARQKAAMIR